MYFVKALHVFCKKKCARFVLRCCTFLPIAARHTPRESRAMSTHHQHNVDEAPAGKGRAIGRVPPPRPQTACLHHQRWDNAPTTPAIALCSLAADVARFCANFACCRAICAKTHEVCASTCKSCGKSRAKFTRKKNCYETYCRNL